jgi:hypothetical protein
VADPLCGAGIAAPSGGSLASRSKASMLPPVKRSTQTKSASLTSVACGGTRTLVAAAMNCDTFGSTHSFQDSVATTGAPANKGAVIPDGGEV